MIAFAVKPADPFARLDVFSEAGPGRVNEDRAGAVETAAWVLDGTTGLSGRRLLPGPSDAAWFVDAVDRGLRRHAERDLEIGDLLRRVIREARREFEAAAPRQEEQEEEDPEQPAASFTAARRRRDGALELGNVGDCRILRRDRRGVVTAFGSSPVSELDRHVVEELVRLRAEGVESYAEAWRLLVEVILRNRTLANREGGYWVLDLSERWLPRIQRRVLAWTPGEHLLLVSDGFYRLVDTLRFYTDRELFEAALSRGLDDLAGELRRTEREDPECVIHPRIKVHDDATALLLRLEGGG